ncbi:hypothetical protein AB0K52_24190 [Glycomyces sp. NPDC049804]|uniref:hypothetical protein n=1 Tax=Glycomyces sp. NPDC049804 TaxID=3154363 RepID=UPI003437ADFD
MSYPQDEQSRLHQQYFGHPLAYGCCGPPQGAPQHQQHWQQRPVAPVHPEPRPAAIERAPRQPQVYTGPLPGGDPKAQAWKNYGMQWLLGLGFLAVIGIFALIYNLATGAW